LRSRKSSIPNIHIINPIVNPSRQTQSPIVIPAIVQSLIAAIINRMAQSPNRRIADKSSIVNPQSSMDSEPRGGEGESGERYGNTDASVSAPIDLYAQPACLIDHDDVGNAADDQHVASQRGG
jgi:hypothetical protein